MVEAMVALGALTLGYLAVITLLNQSLGTSATVSDRNIATYLAAEGIEIVRNLSDANVRKGALFDDFSNGNNLDFEVSWDDLLESDSPSLDVDNYNPGRRVLNFNERRPLKYDPSPNGKGYNYTIGQDTRFYRIIYTTVQPSYIRVNSVVYWAGKNNFKDNVLLSDFFFNWR
ncbi:MAG: hypothetical protein AAB787_00555 [Patescibacteria group bacterium]